MRRLKRRNVSERTKQSEVRCGSEEWGESSSEEEFEKSPIKNMIATTVLSGKKGLCKVEHSPNISSKGIYEEEDWRSDHEKEEGNGMPGAKTLTQTQNPHVLVSGRKRLYKAKPSASLAANELSEEEDWRSDDGDADMHIHAKAPEKASLDASGRFDNIPSTEKHISTVPATLESAILSIQPKTPKEWILWLVARCAPLHVLREALDALENACTMAETQAKTDPIDRNASLDWSPAAVRDAAVTLFALDFPDRMMSCAEATTSGRRPQYGTHGPTETSLTLTLIGTEYHTDTLHSASLPFPCSPLLLALTAAALDATVQSPHDQQPNSEPDKNKTKMEPNLPNRTPGSRFQLAGELMKRYPKTSLQIISSPFCADKTLLHWLDYSNAFLRLESTSSFSLKSESRTSSTTSQQQNTDSSATSMLKRKKEKPLTTLLLSAAAVTPSTLSAIFLALSDKWKEEEKIRTYSDQPDSESAQFMSAVHINAPSSGSGDTTYTGANCVGMSSRKKVQFEISRMTPTERKMYFLASLLCSVLDPALSHIEAQERAAARALVSNSSCAPKASPNIKYFNRKRNLSASASSAFGITDHRPLSQTKRARKEEVRRTNHRFAQLLQSLRLPTEPSPAGVVPARKPKPIETCTDGPGHVADGISSDSKTSSSGSGKSDGVDIWMFDIQIAALQSNALQNLLRNRLDDGSSTTGNSNDSTNSSGGGGGGGGGERRGGGGGGSDGNPLGSCLIHWVAEGGCFFLVALLVRLDQTQVFLRDSGMLTPLHSACLMGKSKVTTLLISHGADSWAVDAVGWGAFLYALQAGHGDCATALLAATEENASQTQTQTQTQTLSHEEVESAGLDRVKSHLEQLGRILLRKEEEEVNHLVHRTQTVLHLRHLIVNGIG
jgi:hypothetical protein